MIGFSLGAHMAGNIGANLKGEIGRITGENGTKCKSTITIAELSVLVFYNVFIVIYLNI